MLLWPSASSLATTHYTQVTVNTPKNARRCHHTFGSFLKAAPTFSYLGTRDLQWPHPKWQDQTTWQQNLSALQEMWITRSIEFNKYILHWILYDGVKIAWIKINNSRWCLLDSCSCPLRYCKQLVQLTENCSSWLGKTYLLYHWWSWSHHQQCDHHCNYKHTEFLK